MATNNESTTAEAAQLSTVANDIVRELRPMEKNQGGLEIYGLPIREKVFNQSEKLRKCTFKRNYSGTPQSKTIIVLATTGSGKRTFINGLVNYVLNVNWSDKFRFKMIDDNRSSQWITKYRLCYTPGSRLNYNLNIIDTPGFGDTRGIQRDAEIFQQIKEMFKTKIQTVDAVCIVVPNSSLRLTATQRYMFDSIMTIFGNDIKKNIFILVTFADTPEPPVIDTLRNEAIPFEKGFSFNNSALYVNNHDENVKFTKIFWDLGMDSFRSFVEELDRIQTASLSLTRDVLDKREQIEMFIINLHQYLREGLCKLEGIKNYREIISKNESIIKDNENFKHETTESKFVAMDGNGKCTKCPQKCEWNEHKNLPYKFELQQETVTKEYTDMKEKNEVAKKGLAGMKEVLSKMQRDYEIKQEQICKIIDNIKNLVNKLHEISLKPNSINLVEYIDMLIEIEKKDQKPGFTERVLEYEKIYKYL